MLYGMYGAKEKPKFVYPPLRQKKKPTPAEEAKMPKEPAPCPQKTVINYPEMGKKGKYKYHAVDFIPRKKHADESQGEIDEMKKRRAVAYGPRGRDRNRMIEELQEIQRYGDKKKMDEALAKMTLARAQAAAMANEPIDDKAHLRSKYSKQIPSTASQHYEEKYGTAPADYLGA